MLKWLQQLVGQGEQAGNVVVPGAPIPQESAPQQGPMTEVSAAAPSPQTAITRQIILDRNAHILGYEFMLHSGPGLQSSDTRTQKLNDQLLVRTVNGLGTDRIGQFREIWLTVGDVSLSSPLFDGLPPKSTVLLVRPVSHQMPGAELAEQVAGLKTRGFRIGLLGYTDNALHQAWLQFSDYVALDVPTYAPAELTEAAKHLHEKKPGLKVFARRIDSYEGYEYCYDQNFDGFGGKFLTCRENWPPQPPLSANRVRLCNLLNKLRSGADLTELAEELRISPEISYRLLRYINSAGMGLTGHIGSIEQGVLYLGREKLYRWLTLLLFSSTDGKITDRALLEQALVRGRLLELLGEKLDQVQRDELFIVGVFSLFDALLGLPLAMAVRPLQLPRQVTTALLENTGLYAPYLQTALACEQDLPAAEMESLAGALGLDAAGINERHATAVGWAQQLDAGE